MRAATELAKCGHCDFVLPAHDPACITTRFAPAEVARLAEQLEEADSREAVSETQAPVIAHFEVIHEPLFAKPWEPGPEVFTARPWTREREEREEREQSRNRSALFDCIVEAMAASDRLAFSAVGRPADPALVEGYGFGARDGEPTLDVEGWR